MILLPTTETDIFSDCYHYPLVNELFGRQEGTYHFKENKYILFILTLESVHFIFKVSNKIIILQPIHTGNVQEMKPYATS